MGQPVQQDDWSSKVETSVGDLTGRGGRILLAGLAIFAAWASLVPLNSAVVAPGVVAAQGQNKLLQHRTGGTVREILAAEGDMLAAGAPILALDPNVDRAQLTQLRARYALALAMKSRLEAELNIGGTPLANIGDELRGQLGQPGLSIDPVTTTSTGEILSPDFGTDLTSAQRLQFEQGRSAIQAELDALEQRIEGQERQQQGLVERVSRATDQVSMLRQQSASAKALVAKDYLPRQQLWDIQARLLERESELEGLMSERDALVNSIAETRAQIVKVKSGDRRTTSEQLSQVLTELEQVKNQLAAAEVALQDTVVRAPVSGTLVHLKATTIGGVVPPGEAVGEIVPRGAPLEVDARVAPRDISSVAVGQEAKVKIAALNPRIYDDISAKVSFVAADSTLDERSGQEYFQVRVRLDPEALQGELEGAVTPGMTGEIFVEGPSRTFGSYLLQPLTDSLARAFKESY